MTIEQAIYSVAYDDLTEYGKGIRDLLNYQNGIEPMQEKDIIKYIFKVEEEVVEALEHGAMVLKDKKTFADENGNEYRNEKGEAVQVPYSWQY